jgi:hypothetical protein
MATNEKSLGHHIPVTVGTGEVSGNPVLVGAALVGIVEENADATTGAAILNVASDRVFTVTVKAIDGSGNSAVAVGDKIFIIMADTPHLSKKATGVLFGIAVTTLASGTTGPVDVMLVHD